MIFINVDDFFIVVYFLKTTKWVGWWVFDQWTIRILYRGSCPGLAFEKKSPCNQTRKWIKCILSFGLELTIFGILMNVSFGIGQKFFFHFFEFLWILMNFHSFYLIERDSPLMAHLTKWPIYKPMEMAHWWPIWRGLNWTWVKIV